jgi:hypothetical protein
MPCARTSLPGALSVLSALLARQVGSAVAANLNVLRSLLDAAIPAQSAGSPGSAGPSGVSP